MMVEFVVLGSPHGKGRPQFSTYNGKVTARTPQKTVIYENLVKMEYRMQCSGKKFPDDAMLEVEIFAYYDIPKSASKKKQQAMRDGLLRPMKKPDFDNVGKSICDSLNGIAYHDDVQVVDAIIHKYYSDEPRTVVKIRQLGEQEESK